MKNTVEIPISNIEWLGELADDFDKIADEENEHWYVNEDGKRPTLTPGVLKAIADSLRRVPLEEMFTLR